MFFYRQETVESLLEQMFNHGVNESVIINGIGVLLALLEIRRPAPFGLVNIYFLSFIFLLDLFSELSSVSK